MFWAGFSSEIKGPIPIVIDLCAYMVVCSEVLK